VKDDDGDILLGDMTPRSGMPDPKPIDHSSKASMESNLDMDVYLSDLDDNPLMNDSEQEVCEQDDEITICVGGLALPRQANVCMYSVCAVYNC
jgi:hypothetical protein